jgi:hypothetical protein
MGLKPLGSENRRFRYAVDDDESPASIVDVVCAPAGPTGQLGAGTVHHLHGARPTTRISANGGTCWCGPASTCRR